MDNGLPVICSRSVKELGLPAFCMALKLADDFGSVPQLTLPLHFLPFLRQIGTFRVALSGAGDENAVGLLDMCDSRDRTSFLPPCDRHAVIVCHAMARF